MKKTDYRICSKCVMDSSDPGISFGSDGACEYCINFEENIKADWSFGIGKKQELSSLTQMIKKSSRNQEYDCILGLSGGLDSSYLAHFCVREMGLKPLLLHVDTGWNTQESVKNIERIVDGLGLDLFTHVVDWPSMRALQRAYFRSGLPDLDYPQDIAYISALYHYARKYKIKTILNGGNFSTECCREPEEWGGYLGVDKWFVKSVFSEHGEGSIDALPLVDVFRYKLFYRYFFGIKSVYPLNFTHYTREIAEKTLVNEYGCSLFKHKHHENIFTRFYEDYWLRVKFGYEKRRAHLSSLVMTEQLKRSEALKLLKKPVLSDEEHANDFSYVGKKLGFNEDEFRDLLNMPNCHYSKYRNKRNLIMFGAKVLRTIGLEKRLFR